MQSKSPHSCAYFAFLCCKVATMSKCGCGHVSAAVCLYALQLCLAVALTRKHMDVSSLSHMREINRAYAQWRKTCAWCEITYNSNLLSVWFFYSGRMHKRWVDDLSKLLHSNVTFHSNLRTNSNLVCIKFESKLKCNFEQDFVRAVCTLLKRLSAILKVWKLPF